MASSLVASLGVGSDDSTGMMKWWVATIFTIVNGYKKWMGATDARVYVGRRRSSNSFPRPFADRRPLSDYTAKQSTDLSMRGGSEDEGARRSTSEAHGARQRVCPSGVSFDL